jgi:signal transduction histidine kinase
MYPFPMRLFPRLLLLGAGLPTVASAALLGLSISTMTREMDRELDRALLAQAAVESVSLFDGPRGLHLHMATSPLLEQVRPFAPQAAVYDDHGTLLLRFPADADVPERLGAPPAAPTLATTSDGHHRDLRVPVRSPTTTTTTATATRPQQTSTLLLRSSRTQVQARSAALVRLASGSVAALLVVLSVACFVWARSLSGRVRALGAHMARVSQGVLDPPALDHGDDELRELRDAVERATAELSASRRARERFIAEAAHELRTPLASMRVALDLALRRASRAALVGDVDHDVVVNDVIAALEHARDETGRLAALSQGLLEVTAARSAPWHLEAVSLADIAGAAVAARATAAASAGIEVLCVNSDSGPLAIMAHAPSVRRAIDNLVDNAIKHARRDVVVRVERRTDGAAASVVVIVTDDGDGIPAKDVEAVFEPFHRVVQDDRGVGLGLSLVSEVARRHGGRVWCAPGPPGVVTLALPAVA